MRRWSLSYHSQDFQLARAFEAELRRKDTDARIFFAPESLRPGAYWMPALEKEIAEATAFVLLTNQTEWARSLAADRVLRSLRPTREAARFPGHPGAHALHYCWARSNERQI